MQKKCKKIIGVNITNPKANIPQRQTPDAVGYDIYAPNPITLAANTWTKVDTGLKFDFPSGIWARVESRSSFALKYGITAFPGIIDSDYRGELGVLLFSPIDFLIPAGDRIAQLVFYNSVRPNLKAVSHISTTARGEGGFGSTNASHPTLGCKTQSDPRPGST